MENFKRFYLCTFFLLMIVSFASAQTNLALNKPVTVSSFQDGLPAANAVDGNGGTRWGSNWADGEWIRVDLGSAAGLGQVVLTWETAYASVYSVQGSNDDANWINLSDIANGDGGTDQITVSGSYRYVRIYCTTRATGWGNSLWELVVYGSTTNPTATSTPIPVVTSMVTPTSTSTPTYTRSPTPTLAPTSTSTPTRTVAPTAVATATRTPVPTATPVATSTPTSALVDITNLGGIISAQYTDSPASEGIAKLIDNSTSTKYLTFHASGWVQYAGINAIVSRYTISSANDAAERDPLGWTLRGSNNGSTWATIDTRSGIDFPNRLQTLSFTFTNGTAYSYYRLTMSNNSGTILQLSEWELFGTVQSTVTQSPTAAPTATRTPTPTSTSTQAATATPTPTSTPTATRSPTPTPTPMTTGATPTPNPNNGTKTLKKGMAYNMTNTADFNAVKDGLSWFYNWGIEPDAADGFYEAYGIEYVPMLWGNPSDADMTKIRNYILANPEVKYMLVMNEPNLSDQANITPANAVPVWIKYEQVKADLAAQGRNIKIVGPAMTWGNQPGYEDYVAWLDAFYAAFRNAYGRDPIIDYLAFHWYDYGLESMLNAFSKYGKQIWVTEFANWHTETGFTIDTMAEQMAEMTSMVTMLEARPDVFRYAWFIGRMSPDPHYTSLFTANPGELTGLGNLYKYLPGTPPPPPTPAPIIADLGPNVYVFTPDMDDATIQGTCDTIHARMEKNQFGTDRYALMFAPGDYSVNVNVGYYTSVIGLGQNPDNVVITGSVRAEADWFSGNATQNFWRSTENVSVVPTFVSNALAGAGMNTWAVSQAAPFRRMHIKGSLELWDPYGNTGSQWDASWSSGGFIADSVIDNQLQAGSQQQFLTRNTRMGTWTNAVWNMAFIGDIGAPADSWPNPPYTTIAATPKLAEKPYLFIDSTGKLAVFKPALQANTVGPTWLNGQTPGTAIPISSFLIARPDVDTAASINAAINSGKHILLTPGVYRISEPINVNRADTVVLGIGYATIIPTNGNIAIRIADVDGVRLAGVLLDAGSVTSSTLLEVGPAGSSAGHSANPTILYDIFARVGGAGPGSANICVTVNSKDVIADHFWLWRADHGTGVGWDVNKTVNGLVVNGVNFTIYGLFVEHFHEYQTVWNANGGRMYFYQSEAPYDPPNQASWINKFNGTNGYASYKVADQVTDHEAWAMGTYCVFTSDLTVKLHRAIETPVNTGVKFHHMVITSLGGQGEITHVVNDTGGPVNLVVFVAQVDDF